MINLEQVKLLETKVGKAIGYIERLIEENAALHRQEADLQSKLDSYQKRIDELEVLIMRFKEEQGQIEDGILSALDRLSQFEKAVEKAIEKSRKDKPHGAASGRTGGVRAAIKDLAEQQAAAAAAAQQAAAQSQTAEEVVPAEITGDSASGDGTCFEIPENQIDISDPLENTTNGESAADATFDAALAAADAGNAPAESGELDIF